MLDSPCGAQVEDPLRNHSKPQSEQRYGEKGRRYLAQSKTWHTSIFPEPGEVPRARFILALLREGGMGCKGGPAASDFGKGHGVNSNFGKPVREFSFIVRVSFSVPHDLRLASWAAHLLEIPLHLLIAAAGCVVFP